MKHPTLKIEKTEAAEISWGDYGADSPQPGDWSYRTPAVYRVIGPTGRIYTVGGTESRFMHSSQWHYEREHVFDSEKNEFKGGFRTMADCLEAINKREQATLAAQ